MELKIFKRVVGGCSRPLADCFRLFFPSFVTRPRTVVGSCGCSPLAKLIDTRTSRLGARLGEQDGLVLLYCEEAEGDGTRAFW